VLERSRVAGRQLCRRDRALSDAALASSDLGAVGGFCRASASVEWPTLLFRLPGSPASDGSCGGIAAGCDEGDEEGDEGRRCGLGLTGGGTRGELAVADGGGSGDTGGMLARLGFGAGTGLGMVAG
jgi:hypothetical protein